MSERVRVDLKSGAARFRSEERGAVTVDWVVLSGALVGLCLAVMAVVSNGVESLSNDTSDELSGIDIQTRFAALTSLFDGDFSNGAGGFTGGVLATVAGFGEILQIEPDEMAEITLDVPSGATSATIDFDLIGGDDLDADDVATVWINGSPVSFYTDDEGSISITDGGVPGVTVSVDQQYTSSNGGGGAQGDSRASYSITVDNPGTSLTFGVSSDASADFDNEYFALDDVSISADR
ncbi:MAG: hypothetical protein AAF689_15215 [Pseudomonadota bacterium]